VGALLVEAKGGDKNVRVAANKALAELAGPKQLPALVELLAAEKDKSVQKSTEQLLIAVARKSNDKSARTAPVLKLMDKSDVPLKCACLRVLGGVADQTSLDALRKALTDTNPELVDTAVRELAKWPDERAIQPLLKAIPAMENRTHRILAIQGCARMRTDAGCRQGSVGTGRE